MTKRKQAFKLRKQGKSYNYINQKLGIAKSTLSYWFSGKKWSDKITIKLNKKNNSTSKVYLRKYSKMKKTKARKRRKRYKQQAVEEFEKLKTNPLFLTGIGIYWGEGEKLIREESP